MVHARRNMFLYEARVESEERWGSEDWHADKVACQSCNTVQSSGPGDKGNGHFGCEATYLELRGLALEVAGHMS